MINLVDELVLLTVEDEGTVSYTAGRSGFLMSVVGACLVELNERGRIDADLEAVRVLSTEATGHPALDLVLKAIDQGPALGIKAWIRRLTPQATDVVRQSLASLADRGVLQASESRFLWVLKTRRYPLLDGSEKKEAKLRIVSTLLGDDIPTPHDSVLIGLARVGGLLEGFLSASEIDRLSGRISQIGSVDLIAKGVESAIREEQLEVARTFLGPV
ncbi:MAG: GOLPH3/VPS74 family protein [Steroidobacteraceae bacterium]